MAQPTSKPGWHLLSDIDPEARQATCAECGPTKVVYKAHRDQWRCATPVRAQAREQKRRARLRQGIVPRASSRPAPPGSPEPTAVLPPAKHRSPGRAQRDREKWDYRESKGDACERCGFKPEHPCQLDVDHIVPRSWGGLDEPSNWQTLCANCHRLKSHLERLERPEVMVPRLEAPGTADETTTGAVVSRRGRS